MGEGQRGCVEGCVGREKYTWVRGLCGGRFGLSGVGVLGAGIRVCRLTWEA